MRTLRSLLPLALVGASMFAVSPASAQRHESRARSRHHVAPVAMPVATSAADTLACDAQDCDEGYSDEQSAEPSEDYSLSVVNALFPYNDGTTVGPPLVTLVVQNSGTSRSPGSSIAVAPRNHLTLVNRVTIPSLAPGERSVIQVPLEIGPDGATCIAITITPGEVPTAIESLRFASAATTIGAPRPPGK